MRKAFLVLGFCLVLVFGASAQRSIEQLNGYDWVTFSEEAKYQVMRGYYLSCTTLLYMIYETGAANGMTEVELKTTMFEAENRFSFSQSTGEMVNMLYEYFATPGNRKYLLYRTIPFVAGKEWWNRKTGKVEPTVIPNAENGGS